MLLEGCRHVFDAATFPVAKMQEAEDRLQVLKGMGLNAYLVRVQEIRR